MSTLAYNSDMGVGSAMLPQTCDVIVVGAGNAAMCAALAAREHPGIEVLVLERAPEAESGGNTRFTAGAISARIPRASSLTTWRG